MSEESEHDQQREQQQRNEIGYASQRTINAEGAGFGRTACFNCRSARTRCNRQAPCSRCASQGVACRYPSSSNRGRKIGSHNKPDTVEKLLLRINSSAVRDQVIDALLESVSPKSRGFSPSVRDTPVPTDGSCSGAPDKPGAYTNGNAGHAAAQSDEQQPDDQPNRAETMPDGQTDVVAPLHIVEAAFTTATVSATTIPQQGLDHRLPQSTLPFLQRLSRVVPGSRIERLTTYFGSSKTIQSDWQILAAQSPDSTFKLEPTACDPVTSRLIDQDDVSWYFKLFFDLCNPFVGLLDRSLHTPDYVYSTSFTLFSVICALGCAVSTRCFRDRVIYSALSSLAAGSIKWSMAVSVKSLETIQAIILMQYWAPVCQKQSDDPYWLHLNHATRLAREIGIDRAAVVTDNINALPPSATPEFRERMSRNFERTWLYTFIAERSFGIINGRSPTVFRREIPPSAISWWRKPSTTLHDRMVSGIIEIRILLLRALEQRQRLAKDVRSISSWYAQAHSSLEQTRDSRCCPDGDPSSTYLPILAFYMDHSIMVLNAQARSELAAKADEAEASVPLSSISEKTIHVASRAMDLVLSDQVMCDLSLGYINNLFIMICHAVTEIIHVIKLSGIASSVSVDQLDTKMRGILERLGKVAQELPATSAAHLYLDLLRFLVCQFQETVDGNNHPQSTNAGRSVNTNENLAFADCSRAANNNGLSDITGCFDIDFLDLGQPLFGNIDLGNEFMEPQGSL